MANKKAPSKSQPGSGTNLMEESFPGALVNTVFSRTKVHTSGILKRDFYFSKELVHTLANGYQTPFRVIAKEFKALNILTPLVTILRLMELLDICESRYVIDQADYRDECCSIILHASYYLYCVLYPSATKDVEPIFHSHMLNVIQRLDPIVDGRQTHHERLGLSFRWMRNSVARLSFMKTVLRLNPNITHPNSRNNTAHDALIKARDMIEEACPKDFHLPSLDAFAKKATKKLDLEPWIDAQLLIEYEFKAAGAFKISTKADKLPSYVTFFLDGKRPDNLGPYLDATFAEVEGDSESDLEAHLTDELAEVISYIKLDPDEAINTIIRLQPDLESLDLLTRIFTTPATRELLELYGFQAWDIARQHLQFSLRYLENVEAEDGTIIDIERCATLLTVYLRNILPRGFIDPSIVYMDIQELCTRFIWIPAVLEFRKWFYAAVDIPVVDSDETRSSDSNGWTHLGG